MDQPTMAQMLRQEVPSVELEDGVGPGGIGGYLLRRGSRKLGDAGMDALYGVGAAAAGSILAPATGGFSYIPGYGIAGLNLGRAVSGLGEALLHGIAAQRFSRMPDLPPEGN
jgi:hypothetical protein